MPIQFVLLPLFVQVALTFGLLTWMAYHRVRAVRRHEVHPRDIALREPNWPPRVLQIGNAAHNQLEVPLLFYVLTILAIVTRHTDILFVVLAWVYVLLRLVHAYIHVTSNQLSVRGGVFILSVAVLMIMWIIFAVHILAGLP
jgi:hypothetical protein